MKKTGLILILLFGNTLLFCQVLTINLIIKQPEKLSVWAGDDVNLVSSDTTLGINTIIKGGTPGYTYYWIKEDGEVITNKTINITDPGKYTLKVVDANFCSDSDTIIVWRNNNVSLKNIQISVFPNPASNYLYVFKSFEGEINYELISIYGNRLYCGKLKENIGQIDVRLFPKGPYFLKITFNKTQTETIGVILQ